jgi:hypothetical protein
VYVESDSNKLDFDVYFCLRIQYFCTLSDHVQRYVLCTLRSLLEGRPLKLKHCYRKRVKTRRANRVTVEVNPT